MRFVIVTGVSGAGKTSALKMLEDAKYFCVDNLPIPLLEKFASLMPEIHGEDVQNVALGIDARSGRSLDELEIVLDRMKKAGYDFEILFLDAQDSVLVKRYKETRRSHPLAMGGRVDDGIRMEREKMRFLKERADYIIDTSNLLTRELKQEIDRIFVDNQDFCNMMISVLSFGFKYGIPADADLVFDVRFLPNPYYVDELRPLTGLDDRVFNYVMDCDIARAFADKLEDMINFLIPNYVKRGKDKSGDRNWMYRRQASFRHAGKRTLFQIVWKYKIRIQAGTQRCTERPTGQKTGRMIKERCLFQGW